MARQRRCAPCAMGKAVAQSGALSPRCHGALGASPHLRRAVLGPVAVLVASAVAAAGPPAAGEAAPEGSPAGPWGRPIAGVELRSDAPLEDPAGAYRLIGLAAGESLNREAVRRALRNLRASGEAAEVEARVRPVPDGVVAVFAVWTRLRVEEVRIEGDLGLKEAELRKVLAQRQAEPLVEDRVLRGVYRLEELYRAKGHFEPSVRVRVESDATRRQARVIYGVASGPRATVGTVAFDGDLGSFAPATLVGRLAAGPGGSYSKATVAGDAERLQRWLVGLGHLRAQVEHATEGYDPQSRQVDLRYPIEVGPRFEVEVAGADLEELRKKGLLPFLREGYDEALLLETAERLRAHYQGRGHYRVAVRRDEEELDGAVRLRFTVDPGPVVSLESVVFEGNAEVPAERLAALMTTAPRRLLAKGSGRLVDATLASDVDNIRSYYALNGFWDAEVGPARIEERSDGLAVVVPLREGERRSVSGLRFEGAESLAETSLRRAIRLEPGGPFHPRLLDESLDAVRAAYEDAGYDSAQVSAVTSWDAEKRSVEVTIQLLEGPQAVVDAVVVRGNRFTDTEVIERWLGLEFGEPVSTRRLLEVQRHLYELGVFSRVDIRLSSASPFSGRRTVIVDVEEGSARRFFYGLGYDSEDGIRGVLGYSHANLLGRALAGQADARISERESLFRVLLRQPSFAGWRVPVTYSVFTVDESRESFDSLRRGAQIQATKVFDQRRFDLLYTYKRVELDNVDESIEQLEIDRDLQRVRISSLTPAFIWDQRDDPLDPRRGWLAQLQAEYAFPLLLADAEFVKLFTQETGLLDLGRAGVLAASLRFGAIEPAGSGGFADPTIPEEFPSHRVPISERFFAGGQSTHRAYELDRLGIPGETIIEDTEVGGTGLLLFNLDYRFPVAGGLGGTLFLDAGNVWADWRDVNPGEAKGGVGVGVRYLTPIGPLRLDVGWKLDREEGEDPYEIFISFGNPF